MKVITAESLQVQESNDDGRSTRVGSYPQRRLLTEEGEDGFNFVFLRNEFVYTGDEAFRTPRHRHSFAQIRFIEKGEANYAPDQYIGEHEIAYFPRMVWYGPQVKENCVSIAMQLGFDGEHQKGPVWEGYRQEALRRLKARGTINEGTYTDVDPKTGKTRVRDGVEAIYEEQYRMHTNKELVVRPASYETVVLMKPSTFAWFQTAPGVEMKRLGAFFDWPGPNGDVRIFAIRLSKGGDYALSPDRAQVAWTLTPGLSVDGDKKAGMTSIYSPLKETTHLSAEDGVEVYVIECPRLD